VILPRHLEPKLFSILRKGYPREQLLPDIIAGVLVGIVALPLAIAFAIASGVTPEQGLTTAIIGGLIVSFLGGSRVQIAGPTGAFIVIVYGIVQSHGYEGLAVATLMAGVLLVIMGLAKFGTLLRFIPYPLTVGFTSGIAVIIFSSQINDFLGLGIVPLPADFVAKWEAYLSHAGTINLPAAGTGLAALLLIVLWPKVTHRIPGSLVAIIAVTAAVHLLGIPVETIGSRFGSVSGTPPAPRWPQVSWQTLTGLVSPAITIALLGGIESLLSASVADGMIRSRHRSNVELVAQGIANIVTPLFGGIPATGAIARTATNVKNGGRTPVAGIVHALTLVLIMLIAAPWASLIPMPVLAAILLVVAYNMSEWHSFRKVLRSPRSDVLVMLVTFGLTVVVDLTVAIEVGVVLAALFFMRRMAEVSQVTAITRDLREDAEEEDSPQARYVVPEGVEVFEVHGSLFFGAVEQFTESMRIIEKKPKVLILETSHLLAIDATGLRALEELAGTLERQGVRFLISGIHKQPLFAMVQAGVMDRIGEDNVCGNLAEALEKATAG
jgi:SulP family sulfate permease